MSRLRIAAPIVMLLIGTLTSMTCRGRSGPVQGGLQQTGEHEWTVTQPMPVQIGMPSDPPSAEALKEMAEAMRGTGATEVYWFWLSMGEDPPHLGLALAPFDIPLSNRIGRALEPIWKKHRPENDIFTVLPLDDASLSQTIREEGKLLYQENSTRPDAE